MRSAHRCHRTTKVLMRVTIHFSSYIAVATFFCLFLGEEYSFCSYSFHICRSPASAYAIEESDLLLSVNTQEHTSLESSLAEDFISKSAPSNHFSQFKEIISEHSIPSEQNHSDHRLSEHLFEEDYSLSDYSIPSKLENENILLDGVATEHSSSRNILQQSIPEGHSVPMVQVLVENVSQEHSAEEHSPDEYSAEEHSPEEYSSSDLNPNNIYRRTFSFSLTSDVEKLYFNAHFYLDEEIHIIKSKIADLCRTYILKDEICEKILGQIDGIVAEDESFLRSIDNGIDGKSGAYGA